MGGVGAYGDIVITDADKVLREGVAGGEVVDKAVGRIFVLQALHKNSYRKWNRGLTEKKVKQSRKLLPWQFSTRSYCWPTTTPIKAKTMSWDL